MNAVKNYGVLPQAGGYLDQDSLFVYALSHIDAAYSERTARAQAKATKGRKR